MYSSEEFNQLLKALSDDILYAHCHWQMAVELRETLVKNPIAESQSRTFWHLTHRAHVSTAIQLLCRVYDQEGKSLSLKGWLETIKSNDHLFYKDALRRRLKNNPCADSLVENAEKPDAATLNEDITLCSSNDPLVKKLMILRNNYYAHTGVKFIVRSKKIDEEFRFEDSDVVVLLARSIAILNRYSIMFNATFHTAEMLGQDDYKFIFKAVDEKVREMRASSIKK